VVPGMAGAGVGKLPLPGEEPTKAQKAARQVRRASGVHRHARRIPADPSRPQTSIDTRRAVHDRPAMTNLGRGTMLAASALAAAAVGVAAPQAPAALTAEGVQIRGHAAHERIVVAFTGGRLRGGEGQVHTPDPSPGDGRATVRVSARGITSTAKEARRAGVRVSIVRRRGSVVALVLAPRGRFKFVSYAVDGTGRRLVIDLWRATTAPAAAIRDDGCLRLTAWRGGSRPAVRGLELVPLFEHTVVASLRAENAGGTTLGLAPLTATGFRFRPDFSGYLRPGRFAGPIPHSLDRSRRAMLEAWSSSARDGSLECLVQVPVMLAPVGG